MLNYRLNLTIWIRTKNLRINFTLAATTAPSCFRPQSKKRQQIAEKKKNEVFQ